MTSDRRDPPTRPPDAPHEGAERRTGKQDPDDELAATRRAAEARSQESPTPDSMGPSEEFISPTSSRVPDEDIAGT